MTIIKKRLLTSVLFVLLVLAFAMFFITYDKAYAKSTDSLISNPVSVEVSTEVAGPTPDGKSGIKLTTTNGYGSATLAGNKGLFDLKFRPLSAGTNVNDFEYIDFEFVSKKNEAESFRVRINEIEKSGKKGVYFRVWHKQISNEIVLFHPNTNYQETHPENLNHMQNYDASLRNAGGSTGFGKILGLVFDPVSMELYYTIGEAKVLLVDFDDPFSMERNYASYQTVESMPEFDVVVKIQPASGKTEASVLLYELNGESLGGKDIADTQGPTMMSRINNAKGVAGTAYPLDVASYKAYDVVDGLIAFSGEINVTAPNGATLPVSNGKFTPVVSGKHTINFMPKDSKGNVGTTYSVDVEILSSYPAPDFEIDYEITDELVLNDKVTLPGASFYSPLAGKYDDVIAVSAKLFANGSEIATIEDASAPFKTTLGKKSTVEVVYYATDYIGTEFESEKFIINNNTANYETTEAETMCVVGQYIYADNVDGITHEIISPSGVKSTNERVLVDEVGLWMVNYYYTNNGKACTYTQYVEGVETIQSLWTARLGLEISDEIKGVPEYSRTYREGAEFSSSTPYSYAVYKNYINVADYTINDTLLEWYHMPQTLGSNEFTQLNIYFNDLKDPSRSIRLEHYKAPYYQWDYTATRVYVGEICVQQYAYNGHGGFYGEWTKNGDSQHNNSPLRITFDYANKVLHLINDFEDRPVPLADPETCGVGNEWKGFTDGQLELTIEFAGLTQRAHLLVRTVDNMSMTKKIVTDTSAPKITVECDENNLPKAVVGTKFPIMSAYAMDSIDGKINNVDITVKQLKNGRVYDFPIADDNTFTPNEDCDYRITYTARDLSGNIGTKNIVIKAYEEIQPLDVDIDLDALYPKEILLGRSVVVYPANGIGGSGDVKVKVEARIGDRVIDINDVYATPDVATEDFNIVYILEDYLGTVTEKVANINVVCSTAPVFSEIVVPPAVLANKSFTIPSLTAVSYNADGTSSNVDVVVKINGEVTTEKTYKPTADFTLSYEAGGESASYEIKAITPQNTLGPEDDKVGYLTHFFHVDDNGNVQLDTSEAAIKQNASHLIFNVSGEGGFFFVTPQSALKTVVAFTMDKNTNYIGKINFTFQSVDNVNEKIVLTVQKDPDPNKTTGLVTVNDKNTYTLPGNMTAISPSGISVGIHGNKVVNNNGDVIATLKQAYNGEKFEGFTSEYIYLSVSFEDVAQETPFRFVSLNANQHFKLGTTADVIAPMLILSHEIVPLAEIGKEYTFPEMKVFDILDPEVTTTFSIESPTGDSVYSGALISEYKFTPDQYGKYYVKMSGKDSSDSSKTFPPANVKILNLNQAEIELEGTLPTTATQGDEITMPEMKDNGQEVSFIYLMTPEGNIIYPDADMKVVLSEVGNYKVIYYTSTESSVVNVRSFTIKVKAK